MTHYILTRFLYSQDEVILSLVTSLLKRDNLQESYYWAYELYYSGVDMASLFWKIHFDFYAERNPKLEGYMKLRMNALQEDKDMKHIAYIVRNMFRLKPASTTFILRQFLASGGVPNCIYRGRRPVWLNDYEKPYHNLLLSIKKGHTSNAACHLKTLLQTTSSDELFKTLVRHYSVSDNIVRIKRIEELWRTRIHDDDFHCLLSLIVNMSVPKKDVNVRGVFIVPQDADVEKARHIASESLPGERAYKVLRKKRLHYIRTVIGSFSLARQQVENHKQDTFCHWEYYTMESPLWRARLDRFSGDLDHVNKKISFPDEDNEDGFYDLYAFDFDEQPRDIQDMSLINIEKSDWSSWYYHIFECPPLVELPTGYSYLY